MGVMLGATLALYFQTTLQWRQDPKSELTLQGSIQSLASLQVLLEGKPARVGCGSANWMCLSRAVSIETALRQAFASGKCGNVWNLLCTVYKLELDFID